MANKNMAELSMEFAVHLLKTTENIKIHRSIVNQVERSGTSIGSNIRESNYAQSKADFVSKLSIALKECYETEYWLELMKKTEMLEENTVKSLLRECDVIRHKLLFSVKTAKATEKK